MPQTPLPSVSPHLEAAIHACNCRKTSIRRQGRVRNDRRRRRGDAAGDVLTGIENLTGSAQTDILRGDDAANMLSGLAGNDEIRGADGNDMIFGGAGADRLCGDASIDVLSYATSASTVTVNLLDRPPHPSSG